MFLKITLPDLVASIGYNMFYMCSELETVVIGNSVELIDSSAFYSCSSLASVNIPDSICEIGEWAFWECVALTSIELGNGVTKIHGNAFYCCVSLESIQLPESLIDIGESAFYNCVNLKTITFYGTVEPKSGISVLYNCSALYEVRVPMNYEDQTFLNIPVTRIGEDPAFVAKFDIRFIIFSGSALAITIFEILLVYVKHQEILRCEYWDLDSE